MTMFDRLKDETIVHALLQKGNDKEIDTIKKDRLVDLYIKYLPIFE